MNLQPFKMHSLKDACIARLEGLILSGELKAGEKLPPERELAARLSISRPVLHEALVDLAAKGLVTIAPRHGVTINDFRTDGSLAILSSLLSFHEGGLDPDMMQSLLDMRLLLETETARLAALQRSAGHLRQLEDILAREAAGDRSDPAALTELDFSFHLLVALASGNLIYPLIINSFKSVYTALTGAFFRKYPSSTVIDQVAAFHARLVSTIQAGNSPAAGRIMEEMLKHGESLLKGNGE
jgi:GntR family transcriptional regulator, transcriptional repressor for pyruvate dehydrogenase complex